MKKDWKPTLNCELCEWYYYKHNPQGYRQHCYMVEKKPEWGWCGKFKPLKLTEKL